MQKKDAQERQALTGAKEVAKIERRLRKVGLSKSFDTFTLTHLNP